MRACSLSVIPHCLPVAKGNAVSENVRSWSAMRPRVALIGADGVLRPELVSLAAGFRLRDVTLDLVDVGAIDGANQTAPTIVDVNLRD